MDAKIDKLRQIRQANYFPWLVILLVSGLVCGLALRHNNTTMIKLRSDVYAADASGGNVNAALNNLRGYVYSHMNTNLSSGTGVKPPIQLPATYNRLAADEERKANNQGLYTEAENYCQAKIPASVSISGRGRIGCVQDYIKSHGGKPGATVPASLYQFDFISPRWSPDLAGWSLLVTIIAAVGLVIRLVVNILKPSYK